MTTQVTLRATPPQTIRFPGVCAHCGHPAAARMTVQHRIERATRLIEVPLCAACAQLLASRSMAEERWQKIGWLATAVLSVLTAAAGMLLLPAALGLGARLLLGLGAGAAVGAALFSAAQAAGRRGMRPEKRAVRQAVQIAGFAGSQTTFTFVNQTFAERFVEMNQAHVQGVDGADDQLAHQTQPADQEVNS